MKKTILFIILTIVTLTLHAQDVIVKKNGDEIQAFVQEIGIDDVKYKKFDNQIGPNYTLKKSDIFMIKYAEGDKDVFVDDVAPATAPRATAIVPKTVEAKPRLQNQAELLTVSNYSNPKVRSNSGKRLSKKEIRSIMESVPEALDIYNSGVNLKDWGYSFFIFALVNDGLAIINFIEGNKSGYVHLGLGFACLIPEMILLSTGRRKIATSVSVYNNAIRKQQLSDVSLKFGVTQSGGLGLTLNF